jgi:hypothetical protein
MMVILPAHVNRDHAYPRAKDEVERRIAYVENIPVKAGLVEAAEQWLCSVHGSGQTTQPDRPPHVTPEITPETGGSP